MVIVLPGIALALMALVLLGTLLSPMHTHEKEEHAVCSRRFDSLLLLVGFYGLALRCWDFCIVARI